MHLKLIYRDILKNKTITSVIILFITASVLLVTLASILSVNLATSMDRLILKSKTPHFMQSHFGMIDFERMEDFVKSNPYIKNYQIVEFINIEGEKIAINNLPLYDNAQDNGFALQNSEFDLLLDMDNRVIDVKPGEVYLPLYIYKEGVAKIGDKLRVYDINLTVKGFIRDSMMNSPLALSKRFLINRDIFDHIKNLGRLEYLIEFRLNNLESLPDFEASYGNSGLESNGPTVTYPLFKLLNALSDGVVIGIIIIVSILLVSIALMCIRFSLITQLEEDYREIGIMKAIGLDHSDIRKIYLGKYFLISLIGSLIGITISQILKGSLLENIRLFMGGSNSLVKDIIFSALGAILILGIISLYIYGILSKFKNIEIKESINSGFIQKKGKLKSGLNLYKNKFLRTNFLLGLKDVVTRKKVYFTMLLVLILSSFIIIVPQNIYSTVSSEKFTTLIGVGMSDIRIDIQQVENINESTKKIIYYINRDSDISKFSVIHTKSYKIKMNDGSTKNITVDIGDHSLFPIEYHKGRAPQREDEIALSSLKADDLGKSTGETIIILANNSEKEFTISGIYSDFTNGGKTSKAIFTDQNKEYVRSIIYMNLKNIDKVNTKITEYSNNFSYSKISKMEEFIKETFGSSINSAKKASYITIVIALAIVFLVTVLFMKMLVSKDRYSIGVFKSFGFTNSDIKEQFLTRALIILIVGMSIGTILANTAGEAITGVFLSSFGAASFSFIVNPVKSYLISPVIMILAVLTGAYLATLKVNSIKITDSIKE